MTESNLIARDSSQNEIDEDAKEARKKKIRELEASLFGNSNNDDIAWNPRYVLDIIDDLRSA